MLSRLEPPQHRPRKRSSTDAIKEGSESRKLAKSSQGSRRGHTETSEHARTPTKLGTYLGTGVLEVSQNEFSENKDSLYNSDDEKFEDAFAKMKLAREEKVEKGRREGGWVKRQISGEKVYKEATRQEKAKCGACGLEIASRGKCKKCIRGSCWKWLSNTIEPRVSTRRDNVVDNDRDGLREFPEPAAREEEGRCSLQCPPSATQGAWDGTAAGWLEDPIRNHNERAQMMGLEQFPN